MISSTDAPFKTAHGINIDEKVLIFNRLGDIGIRKSFLRYRVAPAGVLRVGQMQDPRMFG